MKHSERFTNAVTKLYNAFHKGTLNANDCSACAVGNICDGNASWSMLIMRHGSGILYKENCLYEYGEQAVYDTGYSPQEIVNIEKIFLEATNWHNKGLTPYFTQGENFKGLCAVVEYLCELESIPNIMDYKMLFEYDKESPKHQLSEVFV